MTDLDSSVVSRSGTERMVLALATLGSIGTRMLAPGTFGSLIGLAAFGALLQWTHLHALEILAGFGVLALVAIPICGQAERILGKQDPGEIILDEFVALPLVFLGVPWGFTFEPDPTAHILLLLTGFALFRLFDILKPLGIRRLQNLPSGLGVVADDLGAALATGLCLWAFS